MLTLAQFRATRKFIAGEPDRHTYTLNRSWFIEVEYPDGDEAGELFLIVGEVYHNLEDAEERLYQMYADEESLFGDDWH